jgi:NAD(P)-dependent dehydrogenase (short-subunit alcohol dehydrogenase family)
MTARTCIVTGASRGLGHAVAKALLEAGHRVAGTWCTGPGLLKDLEVEFPESCFPVHLDQRDASDVTNAVAHVTARFGSVEVLINNAAVADERPFEELDDSAWLAMLDTNLLGPVRLVRAVLEPMRNARWGRIVNVSSIGGQWGGLRQVHYAASKAALINFTRSLAKLYAADGIVPIALTPGLFATDMTQNELGSPAGRAKVATIPTGRLGAGSELGAMVVALLGPAGDYVAGQTINLNGGMYFQT